MTGITLKSILSTGCFLFSFGILSAQNLDVDILKGINPQNPNSFVWKGATASAYPVSVGVPIGLWVTGTIKKDKETQFKAYEMVGSLAIAAVLTEGLKVSINRPRPYQTHSDIYPYQYEEGKSFPSGHTAMAFATATSLSLQYKKWYVVVPAYVWAAGVGYSRLYLGAHYPTDVLGGAAIGAGSAFLSHWLTKKILHHK